VARDILRVDGVLPETKQRLQEAAMQRYGRPNASLIVRCLIADRLDKPNKSINTQSIDLKDELTTVEIRLPKSVAVLLGEMAESKFSTRAYYISELIFSHLGKSQLLTDEVEVLRRSNYEIAKIGTNLNQIAKAFNILVQLRNPDTKLPEIGKKISSLRRDLKEHTGKVLKLLEARTVVLDLRGKGRGQKSKK
jgi:predicted DNA-binding protein